jgi:hypothetical protein
MPWILLVVGIALFVLSCVILDRQGGIDLNAQASEPEYVNPLSGAVGLAGVVCVIISAAMFVL